MPRWNPCLYDQGKNERSRSTPSRERPSGGDGRASRRLRSVEQHGKLSGVLIDEMEEMPSTASYRTGSGALVRAYELVGYTPERDYAFIETNRQLPQMYPKRADRLRVASENFLNVDAYRHDSLDFFFGMAEQVTIEVAA